ncbi:MAG: 30S ribosomal protein S9 [Candidatus Eisenbacteria bacterium]|nr:30S ribosomal protein S9 [Candidatus Latescibacterota bacterium]MBD3303476.1 30S ribosomal protein S9 [Candidatus Eisenbacteria bacterium]
MAKTQVKQMTGRRKCSVARARLVPGSGSGRINGREPLDYFQRESLVIIATAPLRSTETEGRFDFHITVDGGGLSGQAGAVRMALARALKEIDPSLKAVLDRDGHLTRDPRMKERKKYGQPGARKRFQFSKR